MFADTGSVLAALRSATPEQQDGAWPVEIKCFQIEVADAAGNGKVCETSLDVSGKPLQQLYPHEFANAHSLVVACSTSKGFAVQLASRLLYIWVSRLWRSTDTGICSRVNLVDSARV